MERGELYEQDFLRWTEEQAAVLGRETKAIIAEQTPVAGFSFGAMPTA